MRQLFYKLIFQKNKLIFLKNQFFFSLLSLKSICRIIVMEEEGALRVAPAPATDCESLKLAVVDTVSGRAALARVKARQREQADDIAARSSEVPSDHGVDVGEDTAVGDGDASDDLVELLNVADGKLDVTRHDAVLLDVAGGDELHTGLEVRTQEEVSRLLEFETQAARLLGDYQTVRSLEERVRLLERECAGKSATSSGSSTLSVPSIADIGAINSLETTVEKRLSVASVVSSPAQVPAAAQDMERGPMSADDMQAAVVKGAEQGSGMPPPTVCPVTRAKPRDFRPGECVLRKPHTLPGGDDTLVYVVQSVMQPDKDLAVGDFVPSMMVTSVVDGGAPHEVPCAPYQRLFQSKVLALAHL
jgi:hypothetical protein